MIRTIVFILCLCICASCATEKVSKAQDSAQKKEAVELYVQLGLGYIRQGQIDIAITKFERALKLDPKSVIAHTAMAMAYTHSNRYNLAQKFFQEAIKYGPKDASANYNYGVYLCGRNQADLGLKHFKVALRDAKNKTPEKSYLEMGKCALKENNTQQAEYYFLQALQRNQIMSAALLEMTKLHYNNGNYRQAEKYFASYFEVGKYGPNALWLGIQIERKLKNVRREQYYINALKKRFPDSKIAGEIGSARVEKNEPIPGKTKPLGGRSAKEVKTDRMRRIDQLIEKYPLPASYQGSEVELPSRDVHSSLDNGPSDSSSTVPSDATTIQSEPRSDVEQIEFLIEQRKALNKSSSDNTTQNNPPADKDSSENKSADFMDLMR